MTAKFLISTAEQIFIAEDSDDEDETLEELTKQFQFKYKNSKKKIEKLKKQIKNVKKKNQKMEKLYNTSNVYPIDQLYNPHQFIK